MASASAVEWIATVAMPISLQARLMRRAISPRLAIRTFSNIPSAQDQQSLAELHRLAIGDTDFQHLAAARCGDRVHGLHGFDDEERVAFLHGLPHADQRRLAGFGGEI